MKIVVYTNSHFCNSIVSERHILNKVFFEGGTFYHLYSAGIIETMSKSLYWIFNYLKWNNRDLIIAEMLWLQHLGILLKF